MVTDKKAGRRWRKRIREVLNSEWDPVGVGASSEDDYDSYAGRVAAMLRAGALDADLLQYLHWAETVDIGMPGDMARLNRVLASLRAVDPPPWAWGGCAVFSRQAAAVSGRTTRLACRT